MQPKKIRQLLESAFGDLRQRQFDKALSLCDRILANHPDQPDALHLAGVARMGQGKPDQAAKALVGAVAGRPGDPEILGNLGAVYFSLERGDEAAAALARATALDPENPHLFTNLGAAERTAGRLDDALTSLERALALRPDHVPALFNLGNTLCSLDRLDEAAARYREVLALAADHAEAALLLACLYEKQDDPDAAVGLLMEFIAANPRQPEIPYYLGLLLLTQGRFADGWRHYAAQPDMLADPGLFRGALGDDLDGRRVVVVQNQGLGDELFFLRFVDGLRSRGAHVTYLADPRLVAMLRRADIADEVRDADSAIDAPSPGDLRLSVADLPRLLGMADDDPPPASIRLVPLGERVSKMARRLEAFGPPPYLGIAWRAGRPGRRVLYKACPALDIAAVLRAVDARVVILQRHPEAGEVAGFATRLGRDVLDLSAANADLEDMLALVGLLDDQLCVSNTNVHLAAALGRTCRVLLPSPPEFRWMATGDESPWFPGMRLYRQRATGDWRSAFDALARDLGAAPDKKP